MTIRELSEENEQKYLSKNACLSINSKGRLFDEDKCEIRTEFCRDRDRIVHSKAFRRLKHKTQVFIAPDNDHYRTRLTHTLEVSQIATTIAKALNLNVDLTEAISLGHDLGHTPFGHMGEKILNKLNPKGFKHYEQSLRVVDVLEKEGKGLNLTFEVRDGILNHAGDMKAETFEGKIIKFADRFAYLNHDIDDAIRSEIISEDDIPKEYLEILGDRHSKRINTLIKDIINSTLKKGDISMSDEIYKTMMSLREFMFDYVYKKIAEQDRKVDMVIEKIYEYYLKNKDNLPDEFKLLLDKYDDETVVCDYIASMTDGYILKEFNNLFVPQTWEKQ